MKKSMDMNILFIHEVDWLNKVVFEIHSLAEALSLFEHRVYAVDYEDTWKRNGFWALGSLETREFPGVSRAISGGSVFLRRPGFIKISGLSRLSAGFTHYREIQRTLKEKGIDVMVLYSVPTNGLQAVRLARKFNIPVVFRSIDTLHQLVRYAALRPAVRFLEGRVYSQVDRVLAITPNLMRYVVALGAKESKVKLLPLPIDTAIFHPSVDCSEIRRKWGLGEGEPVVAFIGTLFDFSGLDGFIRQFPSVLEDVPEAKLLIVGDGVQRSKLEGIIAELGLQNQVIITGFQPYDDMPQYINLATICLNPFLIADTTRDIFPSKILQYLACGRAVLATPLPGMLAVIAAERQGIVYADDASSMAREAVSLLKSKERRQRLGQAGLSYVKQVHDQTKIARQLEAELEEVIREKQK